MSSVASSLPTPPGWGTSARNLTPKTLSYQGTLASTSVTVIARWWSRGGPTVAIGSSRLGDALAVEVGEGPQRGAAITGVRRSVHECQGAGLEVGEPLDGGRRGRRQARVPEH